MTANDRAKEAIAAAQQPRKVSKADMLCQYISSDAMLKSLEMALPMHLQKNAERYARSFMTQIRENPKLAACDKSSLLGAMMTGTALGLDPSPQLGQFSLVPYENRKKGITEAQFQLGYKGMEVLAYRGGCKKIVAHEVYEKDELSIEYGLNEKLIHKPCIKGDRGEPIGYYVAVVLPNDQCTFFYMSKSDVEKHKKRYTKTYREDTPWNTAFDEMAKKTCFRRLFKWLPNSTEEISYALSKDEGIIHINESDIRNKEDVLEAETVHETEELTAESTAKKKVESKEAESNNKALTNSDLFRMQSSLVDIFGDGGLGYTTKERDSFIAKTIGREPTSDDFIMELTEEEIKLSLNAASTFLKKREG